MNSENRKQKFYISLFAGLASFLTPFMSSSINIALPAISKEFKMSSILISWVPTIFLLSSAIFLIPFGKIADNYGRKRIFLLGIIIYTLASFLSCSSFSSSFFLFIRFLHGLGGAMIFSTAIALLSSFFSVGERGKALGINVSATYFGLSSGPFLGGILTHHFSWRSIFIFNGIIGLIIIILTILKLKIKEKEIKSIKFDYWGFILYSFTIIPLMVGFSFLPRLISFLLILFALLILYFFIFYESKTKEPILDIKLFRNNPNFTFSNLAAMINYSATFGINFLLSLYLQYLRNFDPQRTGFILLSQPLTMAIFSPFAGMLSDRKEPRTIASLGMALIAFSLFLLSFIHKDFKITLLIILLFILGFGFALFSSPNTNAIMGSVEREFYGVASATLATMRTLGQMFSMGIIIVIFAIIIGKTNLNKINSLLLLKSIRIIFLIFAFLCFLGIFASLKRGKMLKNNEKIL
ncbi:MAG: MFS transporter [candidate division WOR-3 bacterium]|nr:MFS transporter [candidate division WOR-3 bacterium]